MVFDHYGLTQGFYGCRCGWRATEALVALNADYYGDDYTKNFLPYWGGMTVEGIKQLSPSYIEGIKKADFITLNFGSNDLLGTKTYVTRKVMTEKTAGTPLERATLNAIEKARQKDTMSEALESMLDFIESSLTDVINVETMINDITKAMLDFPQTWVKLIKQIRALNPNATIVAVSIYNPTGTDDISGLFSQSLIDMLNNDMKMYAKTSGEYTFVDLGLPDLTGTRDGSHLGDIGHAQVAQKIIAAVDKTLPCDHSRTSLVNFKQATKLTVGYTGDLVCDDCGKVLERGEAVTYNDVPLRDAIKDAVSTISEILTELVKLHNIFSKL